MTSRGKFDVVYIKGGDVIADLVRIETASEVERQSGPDAFLFGFLHLARNSSVLLLSKSNSNRQSQYEERLHARTLWTGSTWIAKLVSKPVLFLRVLRCLTRAKPKWLLCGASQEMLWASFTYAKLARIPFVHSLHNRISRDADAGYQHLASVLDKACIRRASGVVCHGPYLKRELEDIGVPAKNVQEFDIEMSAFRGQVREQAADRISQTRSGATVLYSGRIAKLKGVFDLLDALAPQLRKNTDLQLLYAGHGNATDALNRAICDRTLQSQVKVLGRLPHRELAQLMSRCKVVVTPTRTRFAEGRCMVAMESLALGVPVVAPDFGPFPYLIVHQKNGLLFEPDSVVDLADKLDSILTDVSMYEELRRGAKDSGEALLHPPQTFAQALVRSLKLATSNPEVNLLREN